MVFGRSVGKVPGAPRARHHSRYGHGRQSAVGDTAVILGPGVQMFVDRFHDIADVTAGLVHVDDPRVFQTYALDEERKSSSKVTGR